MQSVYPQVKSQVVYGAVAPPLVSDRPTVRQRLRVELYTPADAVVIVQASRLEPWKGHSLLLTALAQLQDVEGWVYWLVGGVQRSQEMDYFESLQAQAHSLGMASRVRFVGQRADVPQLLAAADIHCQPNTKAEPFGIAFIEALYANLPVVTTAIGGALEIVDDTCGCLVEPNHPEMLSQALRGLIGDPDRRSQLSQNGFARARQHCDPRQQMDQLCHILEAIA
jgi:glycosyltransferase involved in cell wall biosynthesis